MVPCKCNLRLGAGARTQGEPFACTGLQHHKSRLEPATSGLRAGLGLGLVKIEQVHFVKVEPALVLDIDSLQCKQGTTYLATIICQAL